MHPTIARAMNIVSIKPKTARQGVQTLAEGKSAKVIAITSGKGGVGKTNVTINLAIALAKQGSRVCIFDADTSLANINVVIGLAPRYTIEQLLNGERTVEEILIEGPQGVMIVPAASGIAECANLDQEQRDRLIEALQALETSFDYLLIDTAAGIGESVLDFVQSAQYTILVISTEPTSLTDAFALLRVLKRRNFERPAYVLVNMALNYANSMEVFKRFEAAVRKYLGMKAHYLGYITEDKAIKISVGQQRPVILNHPDALASRCFTTLAAVLSKQFIATPDSHGFSAYWSELAAERGHVTAESALSPHIHIPEAETEMPETMKPSPESLSGEPVPAVTERVAAAVTAEAEPVKPSAGEELHSLLERVRSLLTDPTLEAEVLQRSLAPIVELYQSRFPPPPAPAQEPPGRPNGEDTQEKREQLLKDYRELVGRLEAEETLLHQTLLQMYEYINREMAARSQALD